VQKRKDGDDDNNMSREDSGSDMDETPETKPQIREGEAYQVSAQCQASAVMEGLGIFCGTCELGQAMVIRVECGSALFMYTGGLWCSLWALGHSWAVTPGLILLTAHDGRHRR
jgi:hypothetical protein